MSKPRATTQRWTVKDIISDGENWLRYKQEYAGQVSEDQIAEVEKMLACGDPLVWFCYVHLPELR